MECGCLACFIYLIISQSWSTLQKVKSVRCSCVRQSQAHAVQVCANLKNIGKGIHTEAVEQLLCASQEKKLEMSVRAEVNYNSCIEYLHKKLFTSFLRPVFEDLNFLGIRGSVEAHCADSKLMPVTIIELNKYRPTLIHNSDSIV